MKVLSAPDREVFRLSGEDVRDFLQNLVTNDVGGLQNGAVYAAILNPQGKYLADFFLLPDGPDVLLDADAGQAPALLQRLKLYKLRAKVDIAPEPLSVHLVWDGVPDGALVFADPRAAALGYRVYGDAPAGTPASAAEYDALRVANLVPAPGVELQPNGSFILELGFERLNGVDFRKGCYVGQEVTARMKHKTELRKGLARVRIEGSAEPGTEISAGGKSAGVLHTVAGDRGLAYLRFDRAEGEMSAGEARLSLDR